MSDFMSKSSTITPNDMWNLISSEGNPSFGIAGYESPKQYFDTKRQKWEKANLELDTQVWAGKCKYPKPKYPEDKDGKIIIPTRPSYIQEHIKKQKSGFSTEKFEKYKEFLINKGSSIEEIDGVKVKVKDDKNKNIKGSLYRQNRQTMIEEIIVNENKRYKVSEEQQEKINIVKEKHNRNKSEFKNDIERMIAKYKSKGSIKYIII